MKLCIFDEAKVGVVDGDSVVDVSAVLNLLPPKRYAELSGDPLVERLRDLQTPLRKLAASGEKIPLSSVLLRSPIGHPGKVMAAPVNYQDHLDEALADPTTFSEAQVRRIHEMGLFLKATSSIVGCAEGITLGWPDRRTDHEIELAVVIGQRCRTVSREQALGVVAGYCIGLDITIRGPEERSLRKSLDSYSVLGPFMVTSDEVGDPGDLDLTLKVNGEVRQQANTRDLIIDVPGLIAYASAWYSLEPGDVLLTGTPSGVGPLSPGDIVHAAIDRVGSMEVRVHDDG
jgi:2,4-diketo-3-deoxy-L-fuconate hydrolase